MNKINWNKRDIEFRAWNQTESRMYYNISIIPNWGAIKNGYSGTCFNKNANAGIPLQYSGLKDKNGVKIFEVDILQKLDYDYDSDEYNAWNWDETNLVPKPAKIPVKYDYCDLSRFRYWLSQESFGHEGENLEDSKDWEVIGNVFENPELLEKLKSE